MDLETFKNKSKELYAKTCSQDINDINISNTELLKILIKKFEEINYPNWKFTDGNVTFNQEDIRFQLWTRMEMTITWYYHNLNLTIDNYSYIIDANLDLGYHLEFSSHSLLFKEVYDRTSFLSKFFFDIEYFIQKINSEIDFIEKTSAKKKSHYFQALLEFINLSDTISVNEIIDDVNRLLGTELLIKQADKNLNYFLIFDYISTLRNCFHNNGYSQKNLNNLNIGGIKIEIKKGEQASMNHGVIFILTFMIIHILEKITLKLLSDYQIIWKDKYLDELRDKIEEKRQQKLILP